MGEGGKAPSVPASQYLVDNIPLTDLFLHSLSQLAQGLLAKQAKLSSREARAELEMLPLSIDKVTAWPVRVCHCLFAARVPAALGNCLCLRLALLSSFLFFPGLFCPMVPSLSLQ